MFDHRVRPFRNIDKVSQCSKYLLSKVLPRRQAPFALKLQKAEPKANLRYEV